ncbi:cation diffusion facilitator family transporter [Aliiglaciecola sp. CAU 1673]|uniref:cation diffusion facilitator family transporter n=1 Tax=Aliiglaciecola sp. CAU 1673 TaxID=3032595 RepID=UPI0023DB83E6|nr:cation diffusion facilitator family transporter [Aliiglaciecola sp. CAU 1673]MDF2178697.1 cation diffusion facilitator family transporter [Aliiglaciecola sp. CAU 1673]
MNQAGADKAAHDYSFWVKLASSCAVFAAISMILVKIWAWYVTDSASMLASLTDSVFDVAASLINFFVIRYALMPADEDHKFGHGKAESLAGLAQSAFIFGSGLLLVLHAVDALKSPQPLNRPELAIYATLFSVFMTLALVMVQRIAIARTRSLAVRADSLHYQSDLLMNSAVLVALWLSTQGYFAMDAWFAIGIALYLMWGAWGIAKDSADTLMDKEMPEDIVRQVEQIANAHPHVHGIHDIRTRQSGRTIFVQFHLELDDDLKLVDAHGIADKVEAAVVREIPDAQVLIHQDPLSVAKKNGVHKAPSDDKNDEATPTVTRPSQSHQKTSE